MRLQSFFYELQQLLGVSANTTSHNEKIISAVGGGLGIAGIMWVMHFLVQAQLLTMQSSIMTVSYTHLTLPTTPYV